MDYFPLFMDLRGQPVLLVGAGSVAERKARLLLGAGAEVRVVARELNGQFDAWRREGRVRWLARDWDEDILDEIRLVVAATPDRDLNRRVHAARFTRVAGPLKIVWESGLMAKSRTSVDFPTWRAPRTRSGFRPRRPSHRPSSAVARRNMPGEHETGACNMQDVRV